MEKIEKLYLYANIITSLIIDEKGTETIKNALIILEAFNDMVFVTSSFTFTEVAKILIHTKKFNPKDVAKKLNKISREKKIGNFEFEVISTSPNTIYTFEEFWISVSENINLYNPGWGDAIHCVVMKNNNIKYILSTDEKDDFEIVPGISLIHPKDIST